jgi:hypothetical protein
MEFSWSLTLSQPDKEFNEQRKVFRKMVGPQALTNYDSLVMSEAKGLLDDLSGFSGDPIDKIEACVVFLSPFFNFLGVGRLYHES